MVADHPAGGRVMVTMGVRQSTGLFVSPINTSTGLGIVTISFALAIGAVHLGRGAAGRRRGGRPLRAGRGAGGGVVLLAWAAR
jgi:hypothetical protein